MKQKSGIRIVDTLMDLLSDAGSIPAASTIFFRVQSDQRATFGRNHILNIMAKVPPLTKGPPLGTMKIRSLSLSPNCVGERERVRGHLTDILYITPHCRLAASHLLRSVQSGVGLHPLPSRGEEHSGDLFSMQ